MYRDVDLSAKTTLYIVVYCLVGTALMVIGVVSRWRASSDNPKDLIPYLLSSIGITLFLFGLMVLTNIGYAHQIAVKYSDPVLLTPGNTFESVESPGKNLSDIASQNNLAQESPVTNFVQRDSSSQAIINNSSSIGNIGLPKEGSALKGKNQQIHQTHDYKTGKSETSFGVVLPVVKDEANMLLWERSEIRRKGDFHLHLMVYFYERYYMAITTGAVCSVLAAAFLFFITNSGWKQSHRWLKVLFLTFSVNAAFYLAFPNMFQLQQNITDNKSIFLKYQALDYEMRCYLATGMNHEGANVLPGDMIIYFQNSATTIANIPIGFDSAKMPTWQSPLQAGKNP